MERGGGIEYLLSADEMENGNGMIEWIWKREQRLYLVIDTGSWVGRGWRAGKVG